MTKPGAGKSAVDEFLNPKSMLTPGAAGSLTMAISNSLYIAFAAPAAISTATLSLLFALVVFRAQRIPFWQRVVFYILNALIIFSVAFGTNAAGASSSRGNPQRLVDASSASRTQQITNQLAAITRTVTNHYAMLYTANRRGVTNTAPLSNAMVEIGESVKRLNVDVDKLVKDAGSGTPATSGNKRTFFHRW